jgi:hypothetical protein
VAFLRAALWPKQAVLFEGLTHQQEATLGNGENAEKYAASGGGQCIRPTQRFGRKSKGPHRVVNLNDRNLSVPSGILKVGLLNNFVELAGVTQEQF